MRAILNEWLKQQKISTRICTYSKVFSEVAEQISAQRPDSIIYVNVLEHISNDEAELRTMYRTLGVGARIFIFVPALSWLYGSFDQLIGHIRRYTKTELSNKCQRAGFKVIKTRYFDFFGVAPWWIKYRLIKSEAMEPGAVRFYDECVVPVARAIESLIKPPIGKNVILIGEKD